DGAAGEIGVRSEIFEPEALVPGFAASLEGEDFFVGVPGRWVWRAIAQGFGEDAAVERRARVEMQQVSERGGDVDVACWRGVVPGGPEIGALGNQGIAQLVRAERAVIDHQLAVCSGS